MYTSVHIITPQHAWLQLRADCNRSSIFPFGHAAFRQPRTPSRPCLQGGTGSSEENPSAKWAEIVVGSGDFNAGAWAGVVVGSDDSIAGAVEGADGSAVARDRRRSRPAANFQRSASTHDHAGESETETQDPRATKALSEAGTVESPEHGGPPVDAGFSEAGTVESSDDTERSVDGDFSDISTVEGIENGAVAQRRGTFWRSVHAIGSQNATEAAVGSRWRSIQATDSQHTAGAAVGTGWRSVQAIGS